MKKRMSRLMSILLTATMFFSSVPVNAAGLQETGEDIVTEVEAAEENEETTGDVITADIPDEQPVAEPETDGLTSGDYEYILAGDNAIITKYNGAGGNVTIPEKLDGHTVTEIGRVSFVSSTITGLTIPANITTIGEYAFQGCDELAEVTFADGSDSITLDPGTFFYCDKLSKITLSNRVTSISDQFAQGCVFLQEVIWPEKLTTIGLSAFENCKLLTTSDFSKTSLTKIGGNAFYNCEILEIPVFPTKAGLSIGRVAFKGANLTGRDGILTIPENVTEIGEYAFSGCGELAQVVFEDGSSSITLNEGLFFSCEKLSRITLSNRVVSIPAQFAMNCPVLQEVIWPEKLSVIGTSAFENDKLLTTSDFSKTSLTKIEQLAFYYCESLELPVFPTKAGLSIGRVAFKGAKFAGGDGVLTIPNNITTIGEYAFQDCDEISCVKFEEGSSGIALNNGVFYYCDKLEKIELGNRIRTLNSYFAYCCPKLIQLKGGEGILTLGESLFYTGDKSEIVLTDCPDKLKDYNWTNDNRTVVDSTATVILESEYTVEQGKSISLEPKITVVPDGAAAPKLVWESSAASYASVDDSGKVTGKKEGSVTIKVSTASGILKASCAVKVVKKGDAPVEPDKPVEPIAGSNDPLDPQPLITSEAVQSITLVKGQKFIIAGKGWKSNNKCVKVNKNKVSAGAAGTAVLTGNAGQTINVTVVEAAMPKTALTMKVGETKEAGEIFTVAEGLPVLYNCNTPDVLTVLRDGQMTATGKGNAVVMAYVNGVAFKLKVKVADVDTSKRDFTQNTTPIELSPMQSMQIKAKGFKANKASWTSTGTAKTEGLGKGVVFEDEVIRITNKGKITAIGAGTTTLTSTGAGTDLSFTVSVAEPEELRLHLNLGSAKAVKIYGVKGNLDWVAAEDGSDPDIVKLEKGKIKGNKEGAILLAAICENFTYELKVYVENPAMDSEVFKGKTYKYTVEMAAGTSMPIPFKALYQDSVMKSNKSEIAFADSDKVIYARSKGKAKISGKINGKAVTITVIVK